MARLGQPTQKVSAHSSRARSGLTVTYVILNRLLSAATSYKNYHLFNTHSQIVFGTLKELLQVDFGPPLHSLALCGETHPLESEVVDRQWNILET